MKRKVTVDYIRTTLLTRKICIVLRGGREDESRRRGGRRRICNLCVNKGDTIHLEISQLTSSISFCRLPEEEEGGQSQKQKMG